MTTPEPFDTRFRRFYDSCSAEERELLSAMSALFLAAGETDVQGYTQARSDIGQKLQFQLNEANSIYLRAVRAQSNTSVKYHQTLSGIAQNIK